MKNKQTCSFGRLEDGVAATIFVIITFGAGIVSLFSLAGNSLKQKLQQVKTR